ncbi:MAG: MerR family transcriptional regulator [Candidatus Omnitrophica bacterium]|nr:MerR family transcriptional regulator [Candidatus Omnitrophota bacterium]
MHGRVNSNFISAAEIIREFQISYQAVNHYTNLGLLDVVTKDGNARMYDRDEVKRRLSEINRLVKEGYPLRLIRKKMTGV